MSGISRKRKIVLSNSNPGAKKKCKRCNLEDMNVNPTNIQQIGEVVSRENTIFLAQFLDELLNLTANQQNMLFNTILRRLNTLNNDVYVEPQYHYFSLSNDILNMKSYENFTRQNRYRIGMKLLILRDLHVIGRGNVSHVIVLVYDRNRNYVLWDPQGLDVSKSLQYLIRYRMWNDDQTGWTSLNTVDHGPQIIEGVLIGGRSRPGMLQRRFTEFGLMNRHRRIRDLTGGLCWLWTLSFQFMFINIQSNTASENLQELINLTNNEFAVDISNRVFNLEHGGENGVYILAGIIHYIWTEGLFEQIDTIPRGRFKKQLKFDMREIMKNIRKRTRAVDRVDKQKFIKSLKKLSPSKSSVKLILNPYKQNTKQVVSTKARFAKKSETLVKTRYRDAQGRIIYLDFDKNIYFVKRRKQKRDGSIKTVHQSIKI